MKKYQHVGGTNSTSHHIEYKKNCNIYVKLFKNMSLIKHISTCLLQMKINLKISKYWR